MRVALGIDVGNDRCVLAVARNGGVDVLLNDDFRRETPSLVHFSHKQRLFGSLAANRTTSRPSSTISQLKRLVGLPFHDPRSQADLPRLPYETSPSPDGGIAVRLRYLNKDREFTAVAMLAMLLSHLRRTAERAVGTAISDCVIGIPSYFDGRQRRAYLDAAEVVGLRPLRLMHDGAATALAYGIDRVSDEEPTSVVVFVDVGHCDTQVTVVCFGRGGMVVVGHASDRDLGGRDFDEIVFGFFVERFREQYGIDVCSNAKAKARMMVACEKAKRVLSANKEARVSEESLMDGVDVEGVIARVEFDGMSSDLVRRIGELCLEATGNANVDVDKVQSVELIGSGSRVPAISRRLREVFGREMSRTLNASECVASGCALQCAMLSSMCKVRKYEVRDVFPFPIVFSTKEDFSSASTISSKDLPIPTTKALILFQSKQCGTLYIGVDYNKNQLACSVIGSVNVHEGSPAKAQIHLNLHGIFSIKNAPFVDAITKIPATRMVPYVNTNNKEQKIHSNSTVAKNIDENSTCTTTPVPDHQSFIESGNGPSTPRHGTAIQHLLVQEGELEKQDEAYELIKDKSNALEAYIYETRKKLRGRSESFTNESTKAAISARLEEIEEWLYEDRDDETKEDYTSKMEELKKLISSFENYQTTEELDSSNQGVFHQYCSSTG